MNRSPEGATSGVGGVLRIHKRGPRQDALRYYRECQMYESFDWVEPDANYQAEAMKALRDSWELRLSRSEA